jgi:photosystem II stability/assembly factor-like uncharacterized protein
MSSSKFIILIVSVGIINLVGCREMAEPFRYGLLKSEDGGYSWKETGIKNKWASSITIDPSQNPEIIYISIEKLGISKSTDGGQTFFSLNRGLDGIKKIIINPSQTNNLYLIIRDESSQIYTSNDSGENWQLLEGVPVKKYIEDITIYPGNPEVIFLAGGYEINDCYYGIIKSIDKGKTWSPLYIDTYSSNVVVHPENPDIIFTLGLTDIVFNFSLSKKQVGCKYKRIGVGYLYKSTDGGESWNAISSSIVTLATLPPNDYILIHPINPDIIYGRFTGSGIIKSVDGGETWAETDFKKASYFLAIDPQNPDIVYSGSMYSPYVSDICNGIYKTVDGGTTWKNIALQGYIVYEIAINPKNPEIIYAFAVNCAEAKE